MKKHSILHIITTILAVLTLISCSRKKDKFVNRSWHAMTAKYNTLYNGEVSFEEGRQNLIESYQDNYWKQLPIERLEIREEVSLRSENENKSFARAEEKAAKAIQRHSININDRERNPQIDESFILLGKARYFDQRFIQALEAFNYILYKYPTSNSINDARVWKAKTHIRLDNNEGAIRVLKRLLIEDKIQMTKQERANASSMLAQAYVNLKHRDSAIAPMKVAAANTQINEEKGRYRYILGQLYNKVRERDSANLEFDKIIRLNRRVPREYLINAYLSKARNLEIESDDQIAFLDILNKLEKNWENRPFLDKIYYEKAIFFFGIDSLDIAEEYYEKSLRTNTQDKYLRSLNYETIGRLKFDKGLYKSAGAYMDSTLALLDPNIKRYRVIKKKRDNLDNVILYEGIVKNNDSILSLTKMSKADQLVYFLKYTDSLKADKKKQIKRQKAISSKSLQSTNSFAKKSSGANNQLFYFYNSTTLENGKSQFEAIYGKRELVDNWKVSSLNEFEQVAEALDKIDKDYDIDADEKFNPQLYVDKIPTDAKVIDSLNTTLNEAYFELGVVYKEQLKEYSKATDKFELLLANNPNEKYIMSAKYNLYKIYQSVGNFIREEKLRKDILENHPDSRYAAIVKDPFKKISANVDSDEARYTDVYKLYSEQDYIEALSKLNVFTEEYEGDPVVAKFQLLKALTLGKTEGVSKMKELLTHIALTYPKSEEGVKAQQLVDETVPYLEDLKLTIDQSGDKKYNVLFNFSPSEIENAQLFKTKLDSLIKKRNFNYLKTSVDFYSKETMFVAIHGLKGKVQARAMNAILRDNDSGINLDRDGLSVSTDNYRVIQAQKNLEYYKQIRDSIYY